MIQQFSTLKNLMYYVGDSDQSQPELVRFVSATEGVVVNSKQNTIDFLTINGSEFKF